MLIGERYRERLEKPLISMGIEVLWLPDDPHADPRLAGHADLMALHLGGNSLIMREEACGIVNILTNRGFEVFPALRPMSDFYPEDCGLNGCFVGRRFLHRLSVTDPSVLQRMPSDAESVNINQGYAKCSICVVDERSVITSDPGAAKAAALHGIEALLIRPGFIELPGFDTGFIGGSTFKLSLDKLAFTGTLDNHPDKPAILSFLNARAVRPVYLTPYPVFDIGSAIPLAEL